MGAIWELQQLAVATATVELHWKLQLRLEHLQPAVATATMDLNCSGNYSCVWNTFEHLAGGRCRKEAVLDEGALKSVLYSSFRLASGVALQWILFGSGGHEHRPAAGQLANFSTCTGHLSAQVKSLANTHWLHTPAFDVKQVHNANYKPGSVALFGNGDAVHMTLRQPKKGEGWDGSTEPHQMHASILHAEQFKRNSELTELHQLVIFHYVTRSQDDFVQRKLALPGGGRFKTHFPELVDAAAPHASSLRELFRQFEHRFRLDGNDTVCSQGAELAAAVRRGGNA